MATRESEKAIKRKALKQAEIARASLWNLKTSARKARVLADMVRGRPLSEAYAALAFQARFAAIPLRNLLKSLAANATQRGHDVDSLVIGEIQVHKGPILKRFMPRAQGRATPIRKQSTHIEVRLSTVGD